MTDETKCVVSAKLQVNVIVKAKKSDYSIVTVKMKTKKRWMNTKS